MRVYLCALIQPIALLLSIVHYNVITTPKPNLHLSEMGPLCMSTNCMSTNMSAVRLSVSLFASVYLFV
jgi:hypothetical protein